MYIYILIHAGFFLFFLLSICTREKLSLHVVFSMFIFIVSLIFGLRANIDNDYANYQEMFERVPELFSNNFLGKMQSIHGEYGYLLANSIAKSLSLTFESFLFLFTIVLMLGKYFVFSFLVRKPMLSSILYFSFGLWLVEFIQFRWGMAILFLLLSLYLRVSNKPVASGISLAIAFGFHFFTLVIAPYILFYGYFNRQLLNVKLNIFLAIMAVFFSTAVGWQGVVYLISIFSQEVANVVQYSKYYDAGAVSLSMVSYFMLQFIMVNIINYIDNKSASCKLNPFFTSYVYLSLVQFVFLFSSVMSQRAYVIVSMFLACFLTQSFVQQLYFRGRVVLGVIMIVIFFLHSYMSYRNVFEPSAINVYRSILF